MATQLPGPVAAYRRVTAALSRRDPDRDALRRGIRAAVVLPLAGGVASLVGTGPQTTLFAIFGSVAMLIMVDFPGNRQARAVSYAGLSLNGTLLITVGSLVAGIPWLAVAATFVLAAVVLLAGVVSETVAAGQRPTLLTFVLPVCLPPGPIPDRLLGWAIAVALAAPAAVFLLPPRHHDDLRRHAAAVLRALAARMSREETDGETTPADDVGHAMDALRATFFGADFRPVGLTAGSRALVRVVDDVQWLADRVGEDTAELLGPMAPPLAAVLRNSARVLDPATAGRRRLHRVALAEALTAHRHAAEASYRRDIVTILAERDDAAAIAVGRTLLTRRTVSGCVGVVGRVVGAAAAADARPVWARVLGRRLPRGGLAERVYSESEAITTLPVGFVTTRAVVLLNSLRTGLGLALAVAITHVFPLQHGFWVVLGALSVLRSSASATGTRMLRATVGTVAGFLLGVAVLLVVGVDPAVMWTALPIVAFGAAYVPAVASFTAGQAMFTMLVLIIFNVISPTGWQVGLIRVEDVLIGALVGVVVSVLLWPRGASSRVFRAVDADARAGAALLVAAVHRVTRGASEEATDRVVALQHVALRTSRTVDDAVRQFLSESGGKTDQRSPVIRAAARAVRVRSAAELIADVVPPPLTAYPRVRRSLDEHADAVAALFTGAGAGGHAVGGPGAGKDPAGDPVSLLHPVSDEFVLALRAESDRSALSVRAALPLVTVAANLGELELLYPEPVPVPS